VAGDPGVRGECGGALGRSVGEPGQGIAEVFADWNFEPSTAFDHGEDCRHFWSVFPSCDSGADGRVSSAKPDSMSSRYLRMGTPSLQQLSQML